MNRNSQVARAVHYALVFGAASVGALETSTVVAQTKPAGEEAQPITEVVVTGSRIRAANLTTTSPVTSVTSEDITTQGVVKVEDLINQLPQALAGQNATVSNGATGAATIDLRGLGDARTLVLVDGRRMPYGSTTSSAADVNMVPTPLVERVEVLTGGASAVYGSDAVAGVVNFIMKKNFEGIQVDGQYNAYWHHNDYTGPGVIPLRQVIANRALTNPSQFVLPPSTVTDGQGKEGSIIMGLNTGDNKGNITVYGTWDNQNPVLQGRRDYSTCTLGATAAGSFTCGGSSTSFPGRFTDFSTFNLTIDQTTGNTFRPFHSATDQYNFGPLNYYLRPDRRYGLGSMGHYELNDHADVYTQLMYMNYNSTGQIAPGGIFFGGPTVDINCSNPLMSTQQAHAIGCTAPGPNSAQVIPSVYVGRRNVEGGGRQFTFANSSFRGIFGVKGPISNSWTYDAFAQYSRTSADSANLNEFVNERIGRAVDVVTSPATGQPVCASTLPGAVVADPQCVPYNIFRIGGATPAALTYLQAPGVQTAILDQEVWNVSFTGDLGQQGIQLPTAREGLGVAIGGEYRRDSLNNTTDALLTAGDFSGSGGPTISISGATQVKEAFAEARLPLVQDHTLIKQLGVEAAYRYSDYGSRVTTNTYKFSTDWAPVSDVRFRGSYQHAVRAANIVELFTAQGFNLFNMTTDPCGGGVATAPNVAARTAQCIATGVPAGNVGNVNIIDSPAGQYTRLQGGNQALSPEKSDTKSFGLVFTPVFLTGFNATVDWFDINIKNVIGTFGGANLLNACYTNNFAPACASIHRTPNGTLWTGTGHVDDVNINIGGRHARGEDLSLNYTGISLGRAGKLGFGLEGSHVDKSEVTNAPGVPTVDCTGQWGPACFASYTTPVPRWRHHLRMGWATPWHSLDMSLTWRYYGAVDQLGAAPNTIDSHWGSESYLDLAASFPLFEKAQVRLGINNIIDKNPPLSAAVGTNGNGNTFNQMYDALGRYVLGGVPGKF
jgi:outer membrane receptor protein involved in Fe transport